MVTVELVRCLTKVRELYRLPRTFERFECYLGLVDADGTQVLPLSMLNPMAKEHALKRVDELLALDAEDRVLAAGREAAARLGGIDDALRLIVLLMDDAMGGWTNRSFAEFAHRYERKYEVPRGWASVAIWTSEDPTPELLERRTFESLYRTADERANGPVRTLGEILDREGRTMHFAGHRPRYDGATLRAIRERIEAYRNSHAAPEVFACLYGDEIARSLGYPPLGIPDRGGYDLAAYDAASRCPAPLYDSNEARR